MINLNEIGGGTVRRRFTSGGVALMKGHQLTGDQLRAMPANNAQALIGAGFIEVWPKSAANREGMKRFVISRGPGKYDVVEGYVLNSEHLSKDDAVALAKTHAASESEPKAEAAAA